MEIQLNSFKNINSVNVENNDRIEILNKVALLTEFDIKNVLSATEIFDAEREENSTYRIYGKIEYMSILNGLRNQYNLISDIFVPLNIDGKNIYNTFDFYLLRPVDYIPLGGGTNRYARIFEVIATPDDFELYNMGFSNNVYGEQGYAFGFNSDINVSNYFDSFGFPITELFLFPIYKVKYNGGSPPVLETLKSYVWNNTNTPYVFNVYLSSLAIGNQVYGDIVEYDKLNYNITVLSAQTFQIGTPIHYHYSPSSASTEYLYWKYNPFIPLKLCYFSSDLNTANSGSTSYDVINSIPISATNIGNGNFVWRNILPQGYFDPMTDLGVDYPFVNKKRYLFSSIVLDIPPDLSNKFTSEQIFNEITYGDPVTVNQQPISANSEIGKPC